VRIQRLALICIGCFLLPEFLSAQQSTPTVQRDPQAVNILNQCLAAAGGTQAISAIQDFTGSGKITYFWAGQQVSGSVTVRGLGIPLFRLDAQLPSGTRSWLVTGLQGTIKNADGTTTAIPYSNAVNLGSLTFPYAGILNALNDSSVSVSTIGTTTVNGRQGTVIQVQQTFSSTDDPTGDLAKFNTKNYVIDSQTFAILETQDTTWSDDGRMRPIQHEVIFSNFTTVSGLSIPFSIAEKLGGQQTWSLQLSSISFNTSLATSVFQF
jgi:hypothetical protein